VCVCVCVCVDSSPFHQRAGATGLRETERERGSKRGSAVGDRRGAVGLCIENSDFEFARFANARVCTIHTYTREGSRRGGGGGVAHVVI
jgi:hypothetical protein